MRGLGVMLDGLPYPPAMAWGARIDAADQLQGDERLRWKISGFIACEWYEPLKRGRFTRAVVPDRAAGLSEEDYLALKRFWIGWEHDPEDVTQPKDKRRRTTYARFRQQVIHIHERMGIAPAPLVFEPVDSTN